MAASTFRWYSWFFLIFELVWSFGISWMTHRPLAPLSIRWMITGVFLALTAIFGIIDFVIAQDPGGRDDTPLDRWTIVHCLAGVVFGIWVVPLFYVLVVIIVWECFEFSVEGFGDQEVIMNRVVDVGVAVAGWLIVVLTLIATSHVSFPIA
jgi:hypothetical protein